MKRKIVVGSRQSHLALTQTEQVIEQLRTAATTQGYELEFEVKPIVTRGDRILNVTLSKVGGKGLFVKEIEQAMLDGAIDLAIHSMKDMPAEFPEELINAAVPKRVDPRDCLISRKGLGIDQLQPGAKVGTSSLRRAAQLLAYRRDLVTMPIRGNIETRLKKLETEGFDAIVLAVAGLHRVGWLEKVSEYIPLDVCLPAVGQGALGIQCRRADTELVQFLQLINDKETALTVQAERSFLKRIQGGCQVPIGAHAILESSTEGVGGQRLSITGIVGTPDGKTMLKEIIRGTDPEIIGVELAERLLTQGADRILEQVREQL